MALKDAQFKIKGMHCSGCAVSIETVLKMIDGVSQAKADYGKQRLSITYDEAKVSTEQILAGVSAPYSLEVI